MNNGNTAPTKKDLRIFCFLWALVFFVASLYPLKSGGEIRIWALIVSSAFIIAGLAFPLALKHFYAVWVIFGGVMGNIISKAALFLLFYLLFTPMGIIARLLGKDFLNKKIDREAKTYWIDRKEPPGPMKNQF